MLDLITHQVLVYQQCRKEAVEYQSQQMMMDNLYLHVYSFPGAKRSLKEEDWSDFLLRFLGKLPDVMMRFEYRGFSFLRYLNTVLEWQLRTWYGLNEATRQAWWISEREALIEYGRQYDEEEMPVSEKLEYVINAFGYGGKRLAAYRQRLILLLYKNVADLDEDEFLKSAGVLGLPSDKVPTHRSSLLDSLYEKFNRKKTLSEKRNENYCRYNLASKRLAETGDPEEKALWSRKTSLYLKRIRRLDKQISAVPLVPSNETIAGLLDIPKGSVDSGLFYLRKTLSGLDRRNGLVRKLGVPLLLPEAQDSCLIPS